MASNLLIFKVYLKTSKYVIFGQKYLRGLSAFPRTPIRSSKISVVFQSRYLRTLVAARQKGATSGCTHSTTFYRSCAGLVPPSFSQSLRHTSVSHEQGTVFKLGMFSILCCRVLTEDADQTLRVAQQVEYSNSN